MEHLKEIMFLDIETVPVSPNFELLSEAMQHEWERKAKNIKSGADGNTEPAVVFAEKAGIYSEFAKVVCISFGSLKQQGEQWEMRLKSIANDDERQLLIDFSEMLKRFHSFYPVMRFCGHNIKEFDIPFICRRMIINGLTLPENMVLHNKKPWEVTHLDTLELWRFGDYKNFTALSLLAEVLGIPSPKGDIDGSKVASVYWNDKDLPRIARYCMQDVLTSARVYLRLMGLHHIDPKPVFV